MITINVMKINVVIINRNPTHSPAVLQINRSVMAGQNYARINKSPSGK